MRCTLEQRWAMWWKGYKYYFEYISCCCSFKTKIRQLNWGNYCVLGRFFKVGNNIRVWDKSMTYSIMSIIRQLRLREIQEFLLEQKIHEILHRLPEMEFLKCIFSWGFWTLTRVFSDSSFCLVFYPHFSVLQIAIHELTRVFLFRGFFVKIFKAREEYGFHWNPHCEYHGAKDSTLLLNRCPRITS